MEVACTKDRGYATLTGMDPARTMKSYTIPASKCCNVVTISSTIPLAGVRHGHPLFFGAPGMARSAMNWRWINGERKRTGK